MNQCLHISFMLSKQKDFLQNVLLKKARALGIEGTAQVFAQEKPNVKVIACGQKQSVEEFLDVLHQEAASQAIEDLEVEPFLKAKDFRGVFRIIE